MRILKKIKFHDKTQIKFRDLIEDTICHYLVNKRRWLNELSISSLQVSNTPASESLFILFLSCSLTLGQLTDTEG